MTLHDLEQMLSFIPPHERDTWLKTAMGVKAEFGDAGFDPWDRWSAGSDKYQAKDASAVWKSIKTGGGVGIGTVVRIAQHHGYKCDSDNKPMVLSQEEMVVRDGRRRVDVESQAYRRQEASKKATFLWKESASVLADSLQLLAAHPYLKRKGIQAHGIRLYHGNLILGEMHCDGALMIPTRLNRKITSLQFINGKGQKRFLPSGEKGCYLFGKIETGKSVYICEGFATGASIYEATGGAVMVAFDAGNLRKIAEALRASHPNVLIIFCADDDPIGEKKATEAAQAVRGIVALPDFGDNRPDWATDFNDMARLRGKEAVISVLLSAGAQARANYKAQAKDSAADEYHRNVELLRASDLDPQPISWLWNGWLAQGKVHILGGAPGAGKTTISIALAAAVTTGGRWPDGSRCPIVGNVVIWSGEDDPADTLVPRLELAGADRDRVYFVDGVREGYEKRSFDPARDVEPLQRKLAEIGEVCLLIIDPIVSAIAGDSHKNAEVRRGLQPLADLAAATSCALLGITHFSKGTGGRDPVERITGSLAFGAMPRVVMVAAKNQEESDGGEDKRLLLRAKSNIGPDDGGFEYQLVQAELKTLPGIWASRIVWGQAVAGEARDLLAAADASAGDTEGSVLSNVKAFLRGSLAWGPQHSIEVEAHALRANCKEATITRAKKELNILSRKVSGNFGSDKPLWTWELPTAQGDQHVPHEHECMTSPEQPEDVQQKSMIPFSKFEHLQDDEDWVEEEI